MDGSWVFPSTIRAGGRFGAVRVPQCGVKSTAPAECATAGSLRSAGRAAAPDLLDPGLYLPRLSVAFGSAKEKQLGA